MSKTYNGIICVVIIEIVSVKISLKLCIFFLQMSIFLLIQIGSRPVNIKKKYS